MPFVRFESGCISCLEWWMVLLVSARSHDPRFSVLGTVGILPLRTLNGVVCIRPGSVVYFGACTAWLALMPSSGVSLGMKRRPLEWAVSSFLGGVGDS